MFNVITLFLDEIIQIFCLLHSTGNCLFFVCAAFLLMDGWMQCCNVIEIPTVFFALQANRKITVSIFIQRGKFLIRSFDQVSQK